MLQSSRFKRIYIACGYTELRYGIDGLTANVRERFNLNPSFCLGGGWMFVTVQ